MKKQILVIIFLLMLFVMSISAIRHNDRQWTFAVPANFSQPVYNLSTNPISKSGFELGRKLFYDPVLSSDNIISCGFCHNQQAAFTHHGHDLSHGINDQLGKRNAPALQNLAWSKTFMWDGGVFDLDLQPIVPITSPVEMGEDLSNVLQKLNKSDVYPALFEKAFGTRKITTNNLMKALSQFMNMLVSSNSKYDRVLRNEGVYFTNEEAAGYAFFKSQCASCHTEPLFTNQQFSSNGISANHETDSGRYSITFLKEDLYLFKIPSLRNVMLTEPYMHDGSLVNIDSVLDHYSLNMQYAPYLDKQFISGSKVKRIQMTLQEKKQLKSFLHTLTDTSFIKNKLFTEQ